MLLPNREWWRCQRRRLGVHFLPACGNCHGISCSNSEQSGPSDSNDEYEENLDDDDDIDIDWITDSCSIVIDIYLIIFIRYYLLRATICPTAKTLLLFYFPTFTSYLIVHFDPIHVYIYNYFFRFTRLDILLLHCNSIFVLENINSFKWVLCISRYLRLMYNTHSNGQLVHYPHFDRGDGNGSRRYTQKQWKRWPHHAQLWYFIEETQLSYRCVSIMT